MDYDHTQIKIVERTINGKKYKVKLVPSGMHGKGYRPEIFEDIHTAQHEEESKVVENEIAPEELEESNTVGLYERRTECN